MVDPMGVVFEPSAEDLLCIEAVVKYQIAKQATQHPRLRSFGGVV